MMGKVGTNSKFLLGIVTLASLIFVLNSAFAEPYGDKHGIAYDSVGKAISLSGHTITNPYDYSATASIEFVFEDIDSGNYWYAKKHTDQLEANSTFGTHQSYFIKNTGKFYIHVIYEIDGKVTKDPHTTEFVIFDEYSKAALNGCSPNHKLIVKPDYSKAVCIFDESVDKLNQRGWTGNVITEINSQSENEIPSITLSIETSDDFYFAGEKITLSGYIWSSEKDNLEETPVIIQIHSDNDELIEVAQIQVSPDGHFSHMINALGPQWQQSGRYSVMASFDADTITQTSFGFSTYYDNISDNFFINLNPDNYEELCGYPVTDEMRLDIISQKSYRDEKLPYLTLHKGSFTHMERSQYLTAIPDLQYWFELDNGKQVYFEIGACDLDGSNITLSELGPSWKKRQDVVIDEIHYKILAAPGYSLIYKDTLKPVLDIDNCKRIAEGYTEQQKEKLFTRENTFFDPRWKNQVFPLMDYCTGLGNYVLKTSDGNIKWSFTVKSEHEE